MARDPQLIRIVLLTIVNVHCLSTQHDNNRCWHATNDYVPLRYSTVRRSSLVTHTCRTDRSISIRNGYIYRFNRDHLQWQQLCTRMKFFDHRVNKHTDIHR
jgi:hypothetical protein